MKFYMKFYDSGYLKLTNNNVQLITALFSTDF